MAKTNDNITAMMIYIPAELKARLKEVAQKERRSLSNLVCVILDDWSKERNDVPRTADR